MINKEILEIRDGIYFNAKSKKISYPDDGNKQYFRIEEKSFWFKHRNNIISNLVLKHSKNKKFVDIGGGNGYVSIGLQNVGIEVALLEPGIEGCLNAKKRGVKTIICSDLESKPFHEDTIEVIGLFDVVEHIKDDVSFLTECNNILEDQGLVYLTVPAYMFLWSKDDEYAGHFRRYTKKSIREVLEKAGFEICYTTYFFSFLPLPVFLFRTLPSIFFRNDTKKNDKAEAEHSSDGFLGKVFNKILSYEAIVINRNKKIPFGGSCFVIGKKKSKKIK